MNRPLIILIVAAIAFAVMAVIFAYGAWQLSRQAKARVVVLGPTTGETLRPISPYYTQDADHVWHYVSPTGKVTLRWTTDTKLEERKADNSGPAEEGR